MATSSRRPEFTRALGWLVALVLIALTARVLLILFAGVLFALVLHAFADFAARNTRTPYGLDLVLVVLLLLGGSVTLFVDFAPRAAEQIAKLPGALPLPVTRALSSLHLDALWRSGGHEHPGVSLSDLVSSAIGTAGVTVEIVFGLVVVVFVGIYGAADPSVYARAALAVLPDARREPALRIVSAATKQLQRWLLGRLVAMLFVGVGTGIAFSLLGLPLALPLAVVAGLLTFIEYLGAIVSAIPAVLVGFTRGPLMALWVGLIFLGVHIVEGYVLTPILAKSTVRIPPAYGLASQLLLSTLVGPLGLTFSTPLLVVAVVVHAESRRTGADAAT